MTHKKIISAAAAIFAAAALAGGVYADQHPSKDGPQATYQQATGLNPDGSPVAR